MIRKILTITWLPIVVGVWFAIWVLLTPRICSTEPLYHVIALWGTVAGVLWSATILSWRLVSPQMRLTNRHQTMFDMICYPLLALMLFYLIQILNRIL